jgi:hypothetical protein
VSNAPNPHLDEISIIMKIGILENTLEYINEFEKNKLHKKFERELELYTSLYDK